MPLQLTSRSRPRVEVDRYYEKLSDIVKLVAHWNKKDDKLWDFLTQEAPSSPEPSEYRAFREAWSEVEQAASDADMHDDPLDERDLLALAYNLFDNEARRSYYLSFFSSRRSGSFYADADPVSVVETERHYQYYCYRNRRRQEGLGLGPVYKRWRKTEDCVTFYDEI